MIYGPVKMVVKEVLKWFVIVHMVVNIEKGFTERR
jgi:hypothetical protein